VTEADVRKLLADRCEYPSSQTSVAKEIGCTVQYVNQVLHGLTPGKKILQGLGLRRVVTYEVIPDKRRRVAL
jgi:hypothetical protein